MYFENGTIVGRFFLVFGIRRTNTSKMCMKKKRTPWVCVLSSLRGITERSWWASLDSISVLASGTILGQIRTQDEEATYPTYLLLEHLLLASYTRCCLFTHSLTCLEGSFLALDAALLRKWTAWTAMTQQENSPELPDLNRFGRAFPAMLSSYGLFFSLTGIGIVDNNFDLPFRWPSGSSGFHMNRQKMPDHM